MPKPGKPIPEGYHTATPYIICRDAARALEYYKEVFGAEEVVRMTMPGSDVIMHAEMRIGNSMIMLGEENPQMGILSPMSLKGSAVGIHLYVEDVDALWNTLIAKGAKESSPLMDAFWGDRYGKVVDPFGHQWSLATHKWELSPEEMEKAAAEAFAQMAQQQGGQQ